MEEGCETASIEVTGRSGSSDGMSTVFNSTKIQDTACGIQLLPNAKRHRIPFLQGFATPRWALAFLSVSYVFADSVINGVFVVTLTTVEKQFQLRTTESGAIAGMIDLGACLALLVSSYFGERIYKTQWIGRGIFITGIGCIIFLLPQFTTPSYTYGEEVVNYCGNVTEVVCSSSPLRSYRFVFMLAMVLVGVGPVYLPTIGLAFLDENVTQKYSSLYSGIFFSCAALGPVIGNILGGLTLTVFTEPSRSVTIDTSSPLWVGAWWIGFLVFGIGLFVASVPVMLLPNILPGTQEVRKNREHRPSRADITRKTSIGKRLLALLNNKLYILISLFTLVHQAVVFGFLTYSVKIGVEVYGLTESTAAWVLGALAIGSTVLGNALGGFVTSKYDWDLFGIIKFMFACSVVSFVFAFGFLLQCPEKDFAGATDEIEKDGSNSTVVSILGSCNVGCGCSTDLYHPVCDDNGTVYFSPCYAGCQQQENETVFTQCSCIQSLNTTTVSADKCPYSICGSLYPATAILFASFFAGFLTVAPSAQATIRSVGFEERTTALSAQHIVLIVFGRLVGRLLFSQCFDSACLVSSTECGEQGACRSYQRSLVTRNITILMASWRLLCIVFLGLVWMVLRRKERTSGVMDQ